MDGDCVSNRGAISGGYQDSGRSRMVNMRMLREAQKVRAELRKESAEVKDKLQAAEQAVTAVLGDIQRAESARRHRQTAIERLRAEAKACAYAAQRAEESLGVKEKTVAAIRVTVGDLEAQAADLRQEIEDGPQREADQGGARRACAAQPAPGRAQGGARRRVRRAARRGG
jgi:structural maintenance of chromosome 3 (chondroitin sulfate proteoglycan 6)